ncbi:glycoside hydrolase family 61 protein [Rhizoctonia solani]|uniref:AA9 family lytic polysaccharide monooxygenase n=1 Tax=Rhizoctonia solani TaxID=456999 RepID=A0A8H8NNT3_9AGAM|nr:glycoside hydrolase family 61 protein [Rhizoctonia solani]QRW16580.1 glycoside hydrolase family 61 protein [Rhizoctonia solani]
MLFSSVLSAMALAVSSVSAHGYIGVLTANGKSYKGPVAGGPKIKSPIRQISTTSPYKDVNGPGMTCGRDAKNAALIADVDAGSKITMTWDDHPGDAWDHDLGPLMTYMTKVPEGQTADKFNPANAQWFKVAQDGLKSNGKWVRLTSVTTGGAHSVTIPKNIPSGQYLMRSEIIALHLADKRGGVEFYGNCIQFNRRLDRQVSWRLLLDDKGIHINVFNKLKSYPFPGPAVAKFASGGSVKGTVSANSTSDDDETTTTKPNSGSSKPKSGNTKSKDEEKRCSEADPAKPASGSNKHNARSAVAGWTSRMHKRYLGAVAAPAPAVAPVSE